MLQYAQCKNIRVEPLEGLESFVGGGVGCSDGLGGRARCCRRVVVGIASSEGIHLLIHR